MPRDPSDWENEEETIVSFAPPQPRAVPPAPAGGVDASEDEIATVIGPKQTTGGRPFDDRTVVADGESSVGEVGLIAWLVITQTVTTRRGQMFPLGKLRNDIGRGADVSILLDDNKIGRNHSTVKYEKDSTGSPQFVLYDLASTNGTFVNGKKIVSPTPLQDGDRIQVGDTELVFKKV